MEKEIKNENEEKQYTMERVIGNFSKNLESLYEFVKNLDPVVKTHDKSSIEATMEWTYKLLKIVGITKTELIKAKTKREKEMIQKKTVRKLSPVQRAQLDETVKSFPKLSSSNSELLYKSSFVMMISNLDFLISDIIHYFYQEYPQSLSQKDLSITLIDLKSCTDISECMNLVINKEIENVLYKNLNGQRDYLNNYLKVDTEIDIIDWNKIYEAVERRNIIVHNNDIVNKRYLNSAKSFNDFSKKHLKEGDKINIDENYFFYIFYEIYLAGVILTQNCWRKWKKEEGSKPDDELIKGIYNLLTKEKWEIAEKLGNYAKKCKTYNAQNRLYLDINYCIALKEQNKKAELEKETCQFDISILSPKYILAVHALNDDKENFYRNVSKAIAFDKMKKADFMEWPLFKHFRKDPNYENKINKFFRLHNSGNTTLNSAEKR